MVRYTVFLLPLVHLPCENGGTVLVCTLLVWQFWELISDDALHRKRTLINTGKHHEHPSVDFAAATPASLLEAQLYSPFSAANK